MFFKEPDFYFLELLLQLEQWNNLDDFYYKGIKTDDFPLLSFEKQNNTWLIKSIWGKLNLNIYINKHQILSFIDDFKTVVNK